MFEPPQGGWPAGTRVRFTESAMGVDNWSHSPNQVTLASGKHRRIKPKFAQTVFTVTGPTRCGQDVLLDNGETWSSWWLELADDPEGATPAPESVCLQCGEDRAAIRREKLHCVTMSGGESPEVEAEYPRHRFRPWTESERAAIARDEQAIAEHYDGFVEFMRAHPDA